LFEPENEMNLIEKVIKFGNKEQSEKNAAQQSLFGGDGGMEIPLPKVPYCEPYGELEKLKIEKEVVGFYISGHPLDQFKFEIDSFAKSKFSDLHDLENRIGTEITVAGIVTEVVHRVTKNGKPFGILTMEGYEDNHTFYLFSDDYIRFKEFMVNGWFLYIKGVVVTKQWGDQRPEYKIGSIQLLSEIRDKLSKSIMVNIKPASVNMQIISQIEEIMAQHPGNCSLKVNLVEESENISVDLLSRKFLVSPNDEFLKSLESIPEINFEITT